MAVEMSVRRGRTNPLLETARRRNDRNRDVIYLAGFYWWRYIRPKHFTHAGASEYGYAQRSARYEAIKLKKYGHAYPLVKTGKSQEDTVRNVNIKATAAAARSRCVVKMNAPRLNFINPRSRINPADELRRVSKNDEHTLQEVIRQAADRELRASGRGGVY